MRRSGSITDSVGRNQGELGEMVERRGALSVSVHGVTEADTT